MKLKTNIIYTALLLIAGVFMTTSCNSEGDKFDYGKSGLFITGTENNPVVKFVVDDTPASYDVTVQSTKKLDHDVTLTLGVDASKVDEYNKKHTTNYFAVPESAVEIINPQVKIASGSAVSSAAQVKVVSTEDFVEGRTYLIPVTIKSAGSGENFIESSKTIFLRISRVINFYSIQADANASSNFIFDKPIPLTTFTYEVKIYPQGLNRTNYPQRFMALEQSDETKSLLLRFNEANSSNKLQTILADKNKFISNKEFENNHWYLLTWVYDGSTISFYIDGVLDTSIGASSIGVINFQRYEMGMSWGGYRSRQFFSHRFGELRVWNRALSSSEIAGGLCAVDPQSDGLVGYWKFNEGEGHIFHDVSGHGLDMDWSKSSRDVSENGKMVATPDAANAIKWVKDDINKCAQ